MKEKIQPNYYSSWIVFVRFLEEWKTRKRHFEVNLSFKDEIFVNLIDERINYSENQQPVIYVKSEIFDRVSMIWVWKILI